MLFRRTLKNTIRNLNFVKGINLLLNLSSYFNDKIFNSLGIRKSVKKKKAGGLPFLTINMYTMQLIMYVQVL